MSSKALKAVSAAIDLASRVGDPVKHIGTVRDLANDHELFMPELPRLQAQVDNLNRTIDNLQQRNRAADEHIRALVKELEANYEREAKRFSVQFHPDCGPSLETYTRHYRVRFEDLHYLMPEGERAMIGDKRAAEKIAHLMAQRFEKELAARLQGLPYK